MPAIIILVVVWLGFQVYDFFAYGFGAGSFPHAETYVLRASEGEVIAAIRELQKEKKVQAPAGEGDAISVRDTASGRDYWRFIRFYYADSKETVHTWTRPADSTATAFAFYQIDDKVINQDYWWLPNKLKIRKFNTEIFDPLEAKVAEIKKRKSR